MKVRIVAVNYGETRSINYQSAKIEIGLTADLDEGEHAEEVQLTLEKRCVSLVQAAFLRHNARKAGAE